MHRLIRLVLALCVPLVCLACTAPPLSLESMRGQCMTLDQGGTEDNMHSPSCESGSRRDICGVYAGVVSSTNGDQAACVAACRAARTQLIRTYVLEGCSDVVGRGENLCERACRSQPGR